MRFIPQLLCTLYIATNCVTLNMDAPTIKTVVLTTFLILAPLAFRILFFYVCHQLAKDLFFFGLHFAPFACRAFVVIPHEVKRPVDEQKENFFLSWDPCRRGMAPGRIRGDHHVAKHSGAFRFFYFHGKRNHIGGALTLEILAVEAGDFLVAREHDADLGILTSQDA